MNIKAKCHFQDPDGLLHSIYGLVTIEPTYNFFFSSKDHSITGLRNQIGIEQPTKGSMKSAVLAKKICSFILSPRSIAYPEISKSTYN